MGRTSFLAVFMTSAVLSAQEFSLPTPKGNLTARVTSNSFYLNSFFKMAGTITNNTDWNLRFATVRIAFLDANGAEITPLCPRTPKDAYCVSLGTDIPA